MPISRLEFRLLGPLTVTVDGVPIAVGGPKQRALLALLLLNRNEVVSRDRLVDSLWSDRAPETAQRSLDTYVSRLRALLGGERIERRPPGYVLRVDAGELDLERFEALLEQGRMAVAAGDPATARDRLRDAVGLGRGRALAPKAVDQLVARDDLVRAQEQQREQRPLLGSAQRHRLAVDPDLDRAEDRELHPLSKARLQGNFHISATA